jgi:hypothetical protein
MANEKEGWHSEGEAKLWKSDSVDDALLFVLFIEAVFDPISFSADDIFHNPILHPILKISLDGRWGN